MGKKAKKFFFSVYSYAPDWLAMMWHSPQLYPSCTARLLLASPVEAGRTQPGDSWFSPSSHIKPFESAAGHYYAKVGKELRSRVHVGSDFAEE